MDPHGAGVGPLIWLTPVIGVPSSGKSCRILFPVISHPRDFLCF